MDNSAEVKSLTELACVAESPSEDSLPAAARGGVGSSTRAIALSASSVHDEGSSDVCSAALARTDLPSSAETAARFLAATEVRTAGAEPMWATTSRRELC